MSLTLHGYWRSSAAYRVRIALNLKGLDFCQVTHDLRTGAQMAPAYRALAPQGLIPALAADGQVLTQSPAIIEWLEESHPRPPLLPKAAFERALVRSMASIIACDIHPLNNLRVQQALREDLHGSPETVRSWMGRWIVDGFTALETMVRDYGNGRFCFGDRPTIADCYLIPQIYNARRSGIDLAAFPLLAAVDTNCTALDAFAKAAPDRQPDADGIGA